MSQRRRDPLRDRALLSDAELRAGGSGFTERAMRRLEAREAAYAGHRPPVPLSELIWDLLEEAVDLSARSVEALRVVEARPTDPHSELAQSALLSVVIDGAVAHAALQIAARHASCDPRPGFAGPTLDGRDAEQARCCRDPARAGGWVVTISHATLLARDESEREYARVMRRDPACRGIITATSSASRFGPNTWTIWCCQCGHEAASRGPDHPRFGGAAA